MILPDYATRTSTEHEMRESFKHKTELAFNGKPM